MPIIKCIPHCLKWNLDYVFYNILNGHTPTTTFDITSTDTCKDLMVPQTGVEDTVCKSLILVFKLHGFVNSADENSDRLFFLLHTESCNFLEKQCLLQEKSLVMLLLKRGF